jgi:hypothetical protein
MNKLKVGFTATVLVMGACGLMGFMAKDDDKGRVRAEASQCVSSRGLDTDIIDENTILMRQGSTRIVVKVDGCDLDDFHILKMTYRGSDWICGASDLDIRSINRMGSHIDSGQFCFVRDYRSVTKDEARDLKKKRAAG